MAEKNSEIGHLIRQLNLRGMEVGVIGEELEREKETMDRMSINLLNHEHTTKAQDDLRHGLELKIRNLEEGRG